jgi:hypothetical protein
MDDEQKEQLVSLRVEYGPLLPHLHFLQGLRFALLGASLPIFAGLLTFYLTILPLSSGPFWRLQHKDNSLVALIVVFLGMWLVHALRIVERDILRQTMATIRRGIQLEVLLGLTGGVFAALQQSASIPPLQRTSGMIRLGYFLGLALWFGCLVRTILAL